MRPDHTPLYASVKEIKDLKIRSAVYSIMEDYWVRCYDKRLQGISKSTAGWSGHQIAYAIFKEARWISKKSDVKIPFKRDYLFAMCMLEPVWVGLTISESEKRNWKFCKVAKVWRMPDWREHRQDWYIQMLPFFDMFSVPAGFRIAMSELFNPNIKEFNTIEPALYKLIYHYAFRHKEMKDGEANER